MAQMNLSTKQKLKDIENRLVAEKEEGKEWDGLWVSRCKLLHLEWVSNKVLLYSTGHYIQSPGIDYDEQEY